MSALPDLLFALPCADGEFLADGWKIHAAALPEARLPAPEADLLLAWNASLGGAAKFVLTANLAIALQAELPADGAATAADSGLAAATATGIAAARQLWRDPASFCGGGELPAPAAVPRDLAGACAESGWPVRSSSAPGVSWVELGDAGCEWRARVLPLEAGACLLFAELVALEAAAPAARAAVSAFLLLAGGSLRWARGAIRRDAGRTVAGFEILLPPHSSPGLIAEACSALTVGCRRFGAETSELADETIARDYLQTTGLFPFSTTTNSKTKD